MNNNNNNNQFFAQQQQQFSSEQQEFRQQVNAGQNSMFQTYSAQQQQSSSFMQNSVMPGQPQLMPAMSGMQPMISQQMPQGMADVNGVWMAKSSSVQRIVQQQNYNQQMPPQQAPMPMLQYQPQHPNMYQPQPPREGVLVEVVESPDNYQQAPVQPQQQPQYTVQQPVETGASPKTNLLAHTDGSLLIQEVFLSTQFNTHPDNILDLQGIWARVSNTRNGESPLRLSLRMVPREPIREFVIRFDANPLGIDIDGPNGVAGTTQANTPTMSNLVLICTSDNQRVLGFDTNDDSEMMRLTMHVEYTRTQPSDRRVGFQCATHIPLHIFFHDHPQRLTGAQDQDPNLLSCDDEGPRMTQSAFLSRWKAMEMPANPAPNALPTSVTFQVDFNPTLPYERWSQHFPSIMQQRTASAQPIDLVIKVVEHKLAVNRVYSVASREAPNANGPPELVFYASLKVGLDSNASQGGVLVMAELRMQQSANMAWNRCIVILRGEVGKMWIWNGLQRALRGILLS